MWILLLSLLLLAIVALIAGYIRNRRLQKKIDQGTLEAFPEVTIADAECCGQHEMCEKESLLAAVSRKLEYYDDEELDRFAGRPEEDFTPEEDEIFRDIFYSMQEEDVAGWVRSLQLRGIALPIQLKDEVLLVIAERRTHP